MQWMKKIKEDKWKEIEHSQASGSGKRKIVDGEKIKSHAMDENNKRRTNERK